MIRKYRRAMRNISRYFYLLRILYTFLLNKKILLFSHELTNTGAPRALLNLACIFKEFGYSVIVISFLDGDLKKTFEDKGIPVWITKRKSVLHILPFLFIFNIILCNTVVTYETVNLLQKFYGKKLYWWIHEAEFFNTFLNDLREKKRKICKKAIKKQENIYCVSEYSKSFFEKYNKNIKILNLFVEDEYEKYNTKHNNDKIVISYFGEITPLKGQDIFIDYFNKLPENIIEKFEIKFIGKIVDTKFYEDLKNKIPEKIDVRFFGRLAHSEALNKLASSNVFVLLSRGDSFSISAAEAIMLNKPVIISENVGIKDIIKKENCGFIVKNSKDFINIFLNNDFSNIKSPREAYLNNFSKDCYKKNIENMFNKI